jgi:hypothetical protein
MALVTEKTTHEYYQSSTHVTISCIAKGAASGSTTVAPDGRQLSIELAMPSGSAWVLDLNLYAPVRHDAMLKVGSSRTEVRLEKVEPLMWPLLERAAGAPAPPQPAVPAGAGGAAPLPVAPVAAASSCSSSSGGGGGGGGGAAAPAAPAAAAPAAKKKDWDALAREAEAEEAAAKPEGEEALMKLFRDIFKNGDEDTRRAMVKSFQTSGGTVLSTNWKDEQTKDHEKEGIAPPKGMVWKKF